MPLIVPTNLHLLASRSIRTKGEARVPSKSNVVSEIGDI